MNDWAAKAADAADAPIARRKKRGGALRMDWDLYLLLLPGLLFFILFDAQLNTNLFRALT